MGRPSEFTPDVAAQICAELVEGKSLRAICRQESMPGLTTVFKWLKDFPDFANQYAHAREAQADTLADEITDIADDCSKDYYDRPTKDGETERVVDTEHINRSRLRVEARKWIASKLKPKKYGDIKEVQLSGEVALVEILRKAAEPANGD